MFAALAGLAACSGGGGGSPGPAPTQMPIATAVPTPASTASPSPNPVTIVDSGSTNTRAFKIVLASDGSATLTRNSANGVAPAGSGGSGTYAVTTGVATSTHTSQFFADLAANAPVSALTTGMCTKPASFGTTTTLVWNGSTSGDISCPASSGTNALFADASNVDADLGVAP